VRFCAQFTLYKQCGASVSGHWPFGEKHPVLFASFSGAIRMRFLRKKRRLRYAIQHDGRWNVTQGSRPKRFLACAAWSKVAVATVSPGIVSQSRFVRQVVLPHYNLQVPGKELGEQHFQNLQLAGSFPFVRLLDGGIRQSIRPVIRGERRGAKPPCKTFRPPCKNLLGIFENYWT